MFSSDPIFICGEGRSGTKLLRDIFGKHPSIHIFKCETSIFVESPLHKIQTPTNQSKDLMIKSILATMLSKNRLQAQKAIKTQEFSDEVEQTYSELQRQNLIDELPNTPLTAFDYLANFICTKLHHKERWLEKTPYHINYVEMILDFYPAAKIIINYRDPRAVVASWLKKDQNKSLIGVVSNWNNVAKRISDLKQKYPNPKQIYFMQYEKLIQEPEKTIREICNFLEEEFLPTLLEVQVVNNAEEKGKKGFNQESITRWQSSLSKNQCLLIDLLTKKQRKLFAYEDSHKSNFFEIIFVLFVILPIELGIFVFKKLFKFFKWLD